MKLANKQASDLLGKNKQKSEAAAKYIVNTPDIEAWKCLIENSEYIFSFIKEKAVQNLIRQVNADNYKNIFEFFKYHYSEYDIYIVEKLSQFSNEELNKQVYELLKHGSDDEKAYAANYFYFVDYKESANELFNLLNSSSQVVKENAAQSLGKMNDVTSYEYLIEKLKSNDDWAKVEAAQLLARYGNKDALIPLFESIVNSKMPELIAGEIVALVDISELLSENNQDLMPLILDVIDNIVSGIPEIWPLEVIIDFKLYDSIERLVQLSYKNNKSDLAGKFAFLLLKIKGRMTLFMNDSQYTFDQEKHIVNELNEIYSLLNNINNDYWNYLIDLLYSKLNSENEKDVFQSLSIIKELKLEESFPHLLELMYENTDNGLLLCEIILTVEEIGKISEISNPECLIANINDENLAALVRNAFKCLK